MRDLQHARLTVPLINVILHTAEWRNWRNKCPALGHLKCACPNCLYDGCLRGRAKEEQWQRYRTSILRSVSIISNKRNANVPLYRVLTFLDFSSWSSPNSTAPMKVSSSLKIKSNQIYQKKMKDLGSG